MQQQSTQVKVEEVQCGSGAPITVLRFAGDITSTSQPAVLGTYQGLPESAKRILLDFSKVEYLNSSGIALVIQLMIAASKNGQSASPNTPSSTPTKKPPARPSSRPPIGSPIALIDPPIDWSILGSVENRRRPE
jgi:ABC-type transporter Mla MlaB component